MLELMSMLRPLANWQVLLAICLLDLALIAMRLTWPADMSEESASSSQQQQQHFEEQQAHWRLRELLTRQAMLAQEVHNSRRQLETSRRQLEELMAAHGARDEAESEQLRLLTKGVEDLEQGVAQLVAAQADGANTRGERLNNTKTDAVVT